MEPLAPMAADVALRVTLGAVIELVEVLPLRIAPALVVRVTDELPVTLTAVVPVPS